MQFIRTKMNYDFESKFAAIYLFMEMTSSGRKDGGDRRGQGIKLSAATTPLTSCRAGPEGGGGKAQIDSSVRLCVYFRVI
jgi:hypothetical protein